MYKLLFLLLFISSLHAQVYDGVAVVVEDKAITLLDLQKAMMATHLDAKSASELLIRKKLEELEIKKRKIEVSDEEVYLDIKQLAEQNHMSVGSFYDAVRESNGLTSSDLKKKIKEKLLHEKLFQAIAMGALSQPTDEEIMEYFKLHKKEFAHPQSFEVTLYSSMDREELQTKVTNPMFYSPSIQSQQKHLSYDLLSPQLSEILERTKVGAFTPIIPNGKGGFMSIYINSKQETTEIDPQTIRPEIMNAILASKREEVLKEYFARLRDNADVKILRLSEVQ